MQWKDYLKDLGKMCNETSPSRERYAAGGVVKKDRIKALAAKGRYGDTQMARIGTRTASALDTLIHGGRKEINPRTGLREYPPKHRYVYRKKALPPTYYTSEPKIFAAKAVQGDSTGGGGTCGIHTLDNLQREIGYRTGKKTLGRRNSLDTITELNSRTIAGTPLASPADNEMSDLLTRAGFNPAHITKTKGNTAGVDLPKRIKDSLEAGKQVLFEGIVYKKTGTTPYTNSQANNRLAEQGQHPEQISNPPTMSLNVKTPESHLMKIQRMHLYNKQELAQIKPKSFRKKRRGSLDFLDPNYPGKVRGALDTSGNVFTEQSDLPTRPGHTQTNYPRSRNKPHFNLMPHDTNVIYEVDAEKAGKALKRGKRYPF